MDKVKICIIIPCYNEAANLDVWTYRKFIDDHVDVALCFVNDGSKDSTAKMLDLIASGNESRVAILTLPENKGKAEAVRRGINYGNSQFTHQFIGYLDADLSTSLVECKKMASYMSDEINFVFGSRIRKIGSEIDRSLFRFLVGRMLASIISTMLKLKVYDTQCGCKLFTRNLSLTLFQHPFISKWLFDVEVFYNIILIYGHKKALHRMIEIPLVRWVQKPASKVSTSYGVGVWIDLYRIGIHYRRLFNTGVVRTVTQLNKYVES